MTDNTTRVSTMSPTASRSASATLSRRQLLAMLGSGALAVGLATLPGADPAEGKKKHGKGKGKKSGKGGKGKGKGNGAKGNGGGGGGGTNSPPPSPPSASVEEQLLALINAHRDDNGLAPLTWQDQLGDAAQDHSQDMVDRNFFNHTNPDGKTPDDRIRAKGYTPSWWGENIYQSAPGDPSAQSVYTAWLNSPGHNANMLGANFTEIGIGQATNGAGSTLWTAVFAKP